MDVIWIQSCGRIEKWGPLGQFISINILRRISVNAPTVLEFVLLCSLIQLADSTVFAGFSRFLAVEDDFLNRMSNPFAYMRLFTHIVAHSSFDHLKGKMMYLLLVGPSVEHEFGSTALIHIFGLVAFSSALVHILIGKPYTHQLGASGAVFQSYY
jgi:membrane associated rhomboid family serine protease